ncbi:MAG: transposase [Bacteroidota bacterium]
MKHSLNIYINGDVYTNTVENFWSVLKRGLYGIYQQVSDNYLNEFAARYNARRLSSHERFEQFLVGSESVLTYNELTEK